MRIWRILNVFQDLWLPTPHQIRKFREKPQVHREEEERGRTAKKALPSGSRGGGSAAAWLDCLTLSYHNCSESSKSGWRKASTANMTCAQSLQTLCDPMDCSLLCPWDFLNKNTGEGCHFLLQGIFLIQGSNPSLLWLLHCWWNLYHWATREAL